VILADPGAVPDPLSADLISRLWVVLRIGSGDERAAVQALAGLGVALAVAWQVREVRRSRHAAAAGTRPAWTNAAPGYAFAAVRRADDLAAALRVEAVRGVLMIDGRPCGLRPAEVARFLNCGKRPAAARMQALARDRVAIVGQSVRVFGGPFKGLISEVVEVRDGAAVVLAEVFGALRPVMISLDRLEFIGQG
jgi:transcription antitermination factor NusG